MLAGHRGLHDGALHGLSRVLVQRLRTEVLEAEPAGELLARVVPFPAPATIGSGAGGIAQLAHQPPRLRELVPHPGRHHRVAPGDRQPRQHIRERPAVGLRVGQDHASPRLAGHTDQPCANRPARLRVGRPQRPAYAGEEGVEARTVPLRRGEPVPGGDQIRRFLRDMRQRTPLVVEELDSESGVELRIVQAPAFEPAVLIVIDQVVIGIAGKRQGVQPQRIHRRDAQELQIGLRGGQMGKIEENQVVAQQEGRSLGQRVQLL